MYDNHQNHDNDNNHNIFNLSNLLKRETASGWLGTQCRQENDVTWWQGFKKDNDSPIIKQITKTTQNHYSAHNTKKLKKSNKGATDKTQ